MAVAERNVISIVSDRAHRFDLKRTRFGGADHGQDAWFGRRIIGLTFLFTARGTRTRLAKRARCPSRLRRVVPADENRTVVFTA